MASKSRIASANMAGINRAYYSSKGKAIYSDFSTFAQGSALAACNAMEFVRDFSATSGEVIVCEYGIGKGDFAKTFFNEVKKCAPSLYARTRYHLFDISQRMIDDAKKNLLAHGKICEFHIFDASFELPSLPFDYCRINELLSDLPAEIYARKGSAIFTPDGKAAMHPPQFASQFLSRIEPGRQIPFSFVAQDFLSALCSCGHPGFCADIFDYGFYSADDIFSMPIEEWNRLVVRKYGEQVTADLNFLQLSSALAALGFSAQVEPQRAYCERVQGVPLSYSDEGGRLDYAPKKENDGIGEDDGFYHLRVEGLA
ncbi:MAG: SAM-dependent methyltransferase [Candidatus Micrarchaeota archaeon]|nr:SAM-dependent methyltransferase [Candidatus Micrarchaeota archaeon]